MNNLKKIKNSIYYYNNQSGFDEKLLIKNIKNKSFKKTSKSIYFVHESLFKLSKSLYNKKINIWRIWSDVENIIK